MTDKTEKIDLGEPHDEIESIEAVEQEIINLPLTQPAAAPVEEPALEKKGRNKRRKASPRKENTPRQRIDQRLRSSVGAKLNLGFGSLLALLGIVIYLTFLSINAAVTTITRLKVLRTPTFSATADAETDMYNMLANIRGYLTLGDPLFADNYGTVKDSFEDNLAALEDLSANWTNPENVQRLEELNTKFKAWAVLPPQMFSLRDDDLLNQPALKILTVEGAPRFASGLSDITQLVELQVEREATVENIRLLKDMADFRGSWNNMAAGIRGYLATLDEKFLVEYASSLVINQGAYDRLLSSKSSMSVSQTSIFNRITLTRDELLVYPQQMFDAASGEQARADLYILKTQAAPLAAEIVALLDTMKLDQKGLLDQEVDISIAGLANAQTQEVIVGVISLLVTAGLIVIFRRIIADPVVSLTAVAEKMRAGDLNAQAQVGSKDEIGKLAAAFNAMTTQLKETLGGLEETVQERTQDLEAQTLVLEERSREMEASQRVTFAASERTTSDDFLNLLVNLIVDQFDVYHCQVYLLDDQREHAVLAQSTGYAGRQLLQRKHAIPLEQDSLVTRSIREGHSVLVADVTQDPNHLANPLLLLTKSELVVPLKVNEVVIGALDIQAREANRFSDLSVPVFESMTEHVAFLYENNELIEQIAARTDEQEKFTIQLRNAADVANQLSAILDSQKLLDQAVIMLQSKFGLYHAHIYVLEEETNELVVRAGSGQVGITLRDQRHSISMDREGSLVASAARTRNPVLLADTLESEAFLPHPLLPNTRSELAVPLLAGGQVLGVLDMQDDQEGRFSQAEADTFATLAGQIATTLQTAKLFEEQKLTQSALQDREAQFRTLVDHAPESIVVIDADTAQFVDVNDNAVGMFGHPHDDLLKYRLMDFAPENQPGGRSTMKFTWDVINRAVDGESLIFDWIVRDAEGKETPCEMRLVRLPDSSRKLVRGSITDITERKRVEESLRQNDRMKSEFLANMSHELRTPLNSIIGYAEVMLMGISGDLEETVLSDVNAIYQNGIHLLQLINDVLDLAKIEAGRMVLKMESIEINNLFKSIQSNNAGLIVNKAVTLEAETEKGLPPLVADRLRISQILNNLVSNAVKFTEEGQITLRAFKQDDWICLEVEDAGMGIAEEDIDMIFEKFKQVDGSNARMAEGTGLGLAITMNLVEMHGGKIEVSSKAGKGSTFSVWLPIKEIAEFQNEIGHKEKSNPLNDDTQKLEDVDLEELVKFRLDDEEDELSIEPDSKVNGSAVEKADPNKSETADSNGD